MATPASAQVSAEIAIQSDYRLRGYSLSDGRPVATVSLGYDDPSGFYVSGSMIGMVRAGEPAVLGVQGAAGVALRIEDGLSIDVGLARSQYFSGYGSTRDLHYSEIYLGLASRHLVTRVRFSPDYFRADTPTLYVELDGGAEVAPNWLLSAHAGMLTYLEAPPPNLARRRFDWRIGGTRRLGPYGLHVDLTGRISKQPMPHYGPPYGAPRLPADGTALVASVTRSL